MPARRIGPGISRKITADATTPVAGARSAHGATAPAVAYLRDGASDVELAAAAHRRGVLVRPISQWYKKVSRKSGLMLGFTGFASESIVPAAARLAEVISERSGGPKR